MASYDPLDPDSDPFRPPAIPTLVGCIHCGQEYDSYRIEWRIEPDSEGRPHGWWCCPIPGCDGKGFGFDILPVDPNYQDERGGWVHDDEESEDDDDVPEEIDDAEAERSKGDTETNGEADEDGEETIPF
jgi:hypothetical protein